MPASVRDRNDIKQYDDLADAWWDSRGPFAMLHWLAKRRADLVPAVSQEVEKPTLLDLGCGAGLLAPHLEQRGYVHIGVDLVGSALEQAVDHGVIAARANVYELPFGKESFDVVCAGEILEHLDDPVLAIQESCRVLKPGGLMVLDTIANTRLARFLAVTVAERIHGGAPPGIHDPALFVDRKRLVETYAAQGVSLQLRGLRPSLIGVMRWKTGHTVEANLVPTKLTSVLFQAWGRKDVK